MHKFHSGDFVKFGIYHTNAGYEFVTGFVCTLDFLKELINTSPIAIHSFKLIQEDDLYCEMTYHMKSCLIFRSINLPRSQHFKESKYFEKRYSIGHFGEARGYFNFDQIGIKETDIIILSPGNGRYHNDYRLNPDYKFVRRIYIMDEKFVSLTKKEKDVILEFEDYYSSEYYDNKI